MIVTESVLMQVTLQVLWANAVINASDTILDQRPETVDCLSMDITHYVDVHRMKDTVMFIPQLCKRVVNLGARQCGWWFPFQQPAQ